MVVSQTSKLALTLGVVLLSALTVPHAANGRSVVKAMEHPQPPGMKSSLGPATNLKEAGNLKTSLSAYLRGKYRATSARYYKINAAMGWAQFSKLFAIEMQTYLQKQGSKGFRPMRMPTHKSGLDLTDIYPYGKRMIAVSMAKMPLADGTKLVGIFDIEDAGKP
jgi:hypothetical protein